MSNNKFYLSIGQKEAAQQVASLLNIGNQLGRHLSLYEVLNNKTIYIMEICQDKVIGTIGIEKNSEIISEIKHLCVHPNYRSKGIGFKLLKKATELCKTKIMYGIIRQNNYISLYNALKIGFKPMYKCTGLMGKLIIVIKKDNINC
jgi:GNAT superfamily N-acetyltransferase